jgi:hypothetical protein
MSAKHTVKINFESEEAARHFLVWLCDSGEQNYWQWMECREGEEDGDITAVRFKYHTGGKFCPGLEVETDCGRLEEEEES